MALFLFLKHTTLVSEGICCFSFLECSSPGSLLSGSLCHSGLSTTTTSSGLPWAHKSVWLLPPLHPYHISNVAMFCFLHGSHQYLKLTFLFKFWSPLLEGGFFEDQGLCLTPPWFPQSWPNRMNPWLTLETWTKSDRVRIRLSNSKWQVSLCIQSLPPLRISSGYGNKDSSQGDMKKWGSFVTNLI